MVALLELRSRLARIAWMRVFLLVLAVGLPLNAWIERGVLFGVVALLSFTPMLLANVFPSVLRVVERVSISPIFAGMVFVVAGTWTESSVRNCALIAVTCAAALVLFTRASARVNNTRMH